MHQHLEWPMRRKLVWAEIITEERAVAIRLRTCRDLLAETLLAILQPHLQLGDVAVQSLRRLAIALPAQRRQPHLDLLNLQQRRCQPGFDDSSLCECRFRAPR